MLNYQRVMILPSASHVMNENCSCLASNCRALLARSCKPVWHRGAVISFWNQATTCKTVRRLTLDSPGMAARDSFVHMEMDAEDMEESRIQRTAVWLSESLHFKKSGHFIFDSTCLTTTHSWLSEVAYFVVSDPFRSPEEKEKSNGMGSFMIPGN